MLRACAGRQRRAGHDDARVGFKQPPAQKFRHVHRRGVQRKIPLRLAAAFHPINMVVRLWLKNSATSTFNSPSRRLHSTSSWPMSLSSLVLTSSLTASRNRWIGSVTLSFTSSARRMRSSFHSRRRADELSPPENLRFRRRLNFLARGFDVLKKLVRLAQNFRDQLHGLALAQRGEQTFFRARIPQPVQRIAHLPARHAQADVPRRHAFHRVRLVENHEVVLEQNAAFHFLVHAAEQREKQRVVQDHHVRRQNPVAHALKKTDVVVLAQNRTDARTFSANTTRARNRPAPRLSGPARMSKSDRLPSLVSFDHS